MDCYDCNDCYDFVLLLTQLLFHFVLSRRRTSGLLSSGLWRTQIMVRDRLFIWPKHPLTHLSPLTLLLFTAAIYLAKRNIRKKGILELHEQVRTRDSPVTHLTCRRSLRCNFSILRSSTTACTSGWITNGISLWCRLKSSTGGLCKKITAQLSWFFSGSRRVLRFWCAISSLRAAKERKKPDRVVFECQERAYWVVHRPPVRAHTQTLRGRRQDSAPHFFISQAR